MRQSNWLCAIAEHTQQAESTSFGLISGARTGNDRRAIDMLAGMVCHHAFEKPQADSMLVVRLNVCNRISSAGARKGKISQPPLTPSPLGPWSDVDVDVPLYRQASAELLALPRWISVWKKQFPLLIIDLGPINLVSSRVVGRLCDFEYVVLGQGSCGSSEWILEHAAWHARGGSQILGTIQVKFEPAAYPKPQRNVA